MLGSYYNKQQHRIGSNFVQDYMERKLTDLHHTGSSAAKSYRQKIAAFIVGVVLIVLLPFLHIGVLYMKIWTPNKPAVNRNGCMCSCFDTIFRGAYENPGYSTYKHIYFNATQETFAIWVFTVLFVLMFYESVKYLLRIITERRLRTSMMFLFVINIYPNYYSWWSYFSYYNEEFFVYYFHHMLFTVTELISTCFILNLCDAQNQTKPWKLWIIIAINFMHILSAGADQFVEHVLRGQGRDFQNARDIGLMIPDVTLIVVSLGEMLAYRRREHLPWRVLCTQDHAMSVVAIVGAGTFISRFL